MDKATLDQIRQENKDNLADSEAVFGAPDFPTEEKDGIEAVEVSGNTATQDSPDGTTDELSKRIETPATEDLPPKEELVTMTKEQITALIHETIALASKELDEVKQHEKLAVILDRDEKVRYIKTEGESHQRKDVDVKVTRSYGPIDQHGKLSKLAKDAGAIGTGQRPRWVNVGNKELHSLRRAQGYKPVLVEGNEVRYADSTLMAMPEEQYQTEVQSITNDRRETYHGVRSGDAFKAAGESSGIKTFGPGIQYDKEFEQEVAAGKRE